jgi:hypothetical protein
MKKNGLRFRAQVKRALETGLDAPPELIEFDLEHTFWERFGARLSPERLDEWPIRKIERYRDIIHVIDEVERERASANTGQSAPASTQSPEETERVFQEALRQKRERERQA